MTLTLVEIAAVVAEMAADNVSRLSSFLAVMLFAAQACSSPAAAQSVSLQAQYKMFRTTVILNDHLSAAALIDTGASSLSLCEAMAGTLDLKLGEVVRLQTANGIIPGRRTTVASVRIGAIEVTNVGAVVTPDSSLCGEVLVGMSMLARLHVTLKDDRLTLVAGDGWQDPGLAQHWYWLAAMWAVLMISIIGMSKQRSRLLARMERVRSFRSGAGFLQ